MMNVRAFVFTPLQMSKAPPPPKTTSPRVSSSSSSSEEETSQQEQQTGVEQISRPPARAERARTRSPAATFSSSKAATAAAYLAHQQAVVALGTKKLEQQRLALENARLAMENLKLARDLGALSQDEFVVRCRELLAVDDAGSGTSEAKKKSSVMVLRYNSQ